MDHDITEKPIELESMSPDGGTLAALASAEINQQIATAKRYPRSITAFAREAEQLVTLNEEMARACVYALPRGAKTIEGPSARFAEIMAYSFKNMRYGARPISDANGFIVSQGVAYDLERNNGIAIEVQRRITDSKGHRYNDDMIGVTSNAASSIALRNAVLKIIPKAIWNPIYQKARMVIMGDFATFNNRLAKIFEEFQRYGVTKEMVCTKLERKGVADLKLDDMVVLAGMLTALQEGDSTPEQMFAVQHSDLRQPEERKAADPAPSAAAADNAPIVDSAKAEGDDMPPAAAETKADTKSEKKITASMLKQINIRLKAQSVSEDDLLERFGVSALVDLPVREINAALDWITKRPPQ